MKIGIAPILYFIVSVIVVVELTVTLPSNPTLTVILIAAPNTPKSFASTLTGILASALPDTFIFVAISYDRLALQFLTVIPTALKSSTLITKFLRDIVPLIFALPISFDNSIS